MSEDTSTAVVLAAEDRRAVADALRIATRGKDRPALRSVIVADGLAMVTDTYVAVNVPALAGLPAGAWSADALAVAVKGAGTDGVRIAPVDGDTLRVDRIAGAYVRNRTGAALRDTYADGVPDGHGAGTYYVASVDGAPNVARIYAEAVTAVTAPDYVPELAAFGPERIADVLAARPSGRRPGQAAPVRILPRGSRAAVVTDGGQPYAVVMPMRDA
jgi:hypothetical protein